MREYSVILKPVITEKSAILSDQSKYTFVVDDKSNKVEIKKAFKLLYGVEAKEVKIVNSKSKISTRRGLKRRPYKKAIIALNKGETIDLTKVK